jgi:hypothetical protein
MQCEQYALIGILKELYMLCFIKWHSTLLEQFTLIQSKYFLQIEMNRGRILGRK